MLDLDKDLNSIKDSETESQLEIGIGTSNTKTLCKTCRVRQIATDLSSKVSFENNTIQIKLPKVNNLYQPEYNVELHFGDDIVYSIKLEDVDVIVGNLIENPKATKYIRIKSEYCQVHTREDNTIKLSHLILSKISFKTWFRFFNFKTTSVVVYDDEVTFKNERYAFYAILALCVSGLGMIAAKFFNLIG